MTEKNTIPRHIAFIMDGNGRWAKKRMLPRSMGHEAGVKTLKKITEAAFDKGVRVVSVYAFSTENWNRPAEEIEKLFDLLRRYFQESADEFRKNNIRVMVMGDITRFPPDMQAIIERTVRDTAKNDRCTLNVGLNYGARAEIARAVREIIRAGEKNVTEETIRRYLYTCALPDPDLLIRTGEKRLSNFMLYQCAYTEFYFTDTLWPAFTVKHLEKALAEFGGRERRYGRIGEEE